MAKKKSYDAYVRQQMGDIIDQLQLPNLYKQSLKERWLDQMIWADKKAAQSRRSYYRLRLTTIVGGVILPALVGISVQLGQDSQFLRLWFPPLTFLLSQVIAVSVAIEEFCKFGDRWRDYRKMAEDLKSEGWQYLQSSGPYEYGMDHVPESFQSNGQRSTSMDDLSMSGLSSPSRTFELNNNSKHQKTHLQNYAQFANRIESIIKNDVQGYIANLVQHQAKQDAQAQKVLAQAQAVATDKTIIAQLATLDPGYRDPNAAPVAAAPVMTTAQPNSAPIAGAVGTLRVNHDTVFKLTPQPAQSLPDSQKIAISNGSAFGVSTYAIADHNHFHVTFNQGLGAENRNTWYVFAPHVNVIGTDNKPATPTGAPTAAITASVASAAPVAAPAAAPKAIAPHGPIKLAVPYFTQRDNKVDSWRTCNTSSCAMAAKYLGAKISGDDDYYQYVIKYGDSTDHNAQTKALQDVHIQSTWSVTLDFDDLDKSLATGLPIVIGILHRGPLEAPSGGHIIVVIGRTAEGNYIVNDPYGSVLDDYNTENGKELTYSRHVMTRRWLPDGSSKGWGRLFYGNTLPQSNPGASSIQPMQLSQSVNTSRLTNFSAPLPNSQPSNGIPQCGIELIKEFEGYEAQAYADPIHGWSVPTIGYGTTKYPDGRQVQQGDTLTKEKGEQYLISHIATECTSALEKISTWGKMNPNQRGALYSFAYNLGAAFYKGNGFESITKVCDSSDQWHNHAWVEEQFVKYRNPGTSAEQGLRTRRMAEAKLFCTP